MVTSDPNTEKKTFFNQEKLGSTRTRGAIPIIILVLVLLIPVVMTSTASYTALIKDTDSRYHRAKYVLLLGNTLFCIKDSAIYPGRRNALSAVEGRYRPFIFSMKRVVYIEIIPEQKYDEESAGIPPKFLGTYKINAAGNHGYLSFGVRNGVLYGFIRFPRWRKGVAEPLKGLRVTNQNIRFIRSITTPTEMRRTGAQFYFTQHYYGKFQLNGRTIQGYYTVSGDRKSWLAYKVR